MFKNIPFHTQIFLGLLIGLFFGLGANLLFPESPEVKWVATSVAYPIGQIFLRMIFMVIAPLIFTSLVLGVYDLGDLRKIGRIGAKTLFFTFIVATLAVVTGAIITDIIMPGKGIDAAGKEKLLSLLAHNQQTSAIVTKASDAKSSLQTLLDIIPRNLFIELTFFLDPNYRGGGLIAIMFFAVVFGAAMTRLPAETVGPLARGIQAIYAVSLKIISFAMKLAPLGVAALIFTTSSQLGLQVVVLLGKYVAAVLLALALHQFVTYSLVVWFGAKRSPLAFFRAIREAMLTALSTSSSSATLPTTLKVAHEELKLNKDVSNFVLVIGASTNHNGTALFEGMTVLFIAQFYGIDLTFVQQIQVVFLAVVASIGTAGVPGASLPLIVVVLQQIGVPAEGIGIILGVERILDMSRTVVNVTGDLTVATWVEAGERERLLKQVEPS
ncbi:MAG: dicarboxylate/amino acid:cation symporter [Chloroherpetonaceae bacterium]|nr:dicarboxylate/amino acid:cation symporter [Chloroherpetonaceae bacterium]